MKSERGECAVNELAHFVSSRSGAMLPDVLLLFAKNRLLDAIDALLIAPSNRINRLAGSVARDDATEAQATYWLTGGRGSVGSCAFINCVLVHSSNLDDESRAGYQGATLIPVALAMAEAVGGTGLAALQAIALAYELQLRLASASTGDFSHAVGDQGMRGATVTSTVGAAIVAALIMKLGEAELAHALSFAVSVGVPGIEEPISQGGHERCLQLATNVRMGILSAELARSGLTGASSALEGVAGFYSAYTGQPGLPVDVIGELGTKWLALESVYSRPYPTAGGNTAPVYCLLELMAKVGLKVEEVDRLEVFRSWWRRSPGYVDPGPFVHLDQALISCRFALATALVFGRYDWDAATRAVGDRRVDEWARRIRIDGVATWGYTDGEVTVVTRSGERYRQSAIGMPEELWRPNWADMKDKFLRNGASTTDELRRREIIDEIAHLEKRSSVSRLVDLLVLDGRPETAGVA